VPSQAATSAGSQTKSRSLPPDCFLSYRAISGWIGNAFRELALIKVSYFRCPVDVSNKIA